MAKTVEPPVTDDDIEQAQAALAGGKAELTRLKEAFLDGRDGVEWSAVKSQEAVVEYAEAQIERLARAKARYEESVRQSALGTIRTEMDAYSTKEGARFSDLLKGVETAAVAFASAYVEHNKTIAGWRERMAANGVEPIGNRLSAAPDVQGLSYGHDGEVRAGTRAFGEQFSGQILQELLRALRATSGIGREYFESEHVGSPTLDELYARVGEPSQERPGIPEDAIFYRHPNGGVYPHSPESAYSAADLKRLELTQISRAEALGA